MRSAILEMEEVGNIVHHGFKNTSSGRPGFLSTLLGADSECHGYKVRVVGHSLGGAVAAVLGMMLFGKYSDVHVYAYGPLPCVDVVIAEACSHFVTTIVCNHEFSARLSINSILRLRSAAISALSDNSPADTAMIQKLARRILHMNRYHDNGADGGIISEEHRRDHDVQITPLDESDSGPRPREHATSYREVPVEPPEMFLPYGVNERRPGAQASEAPCGLLPQLRSDATNAAGGAPCGLPLRRCPAVAVCRHERGPQRCSLTSLLAAGGCVLPARTLPDTCSLGTRPPHSRVNWHEGLLVVVAGIRPNQVRFLGSRAALPFKLG